ncbi:small ubiquitin-related modifier 1-like [Ctenocephalides felis]|uniref:small ubiquitin-related modifier 1-like n=1 Tax=Ctenocephalides felis TaxID=7515 RepID=UPI000E6E54D4|nr:small ubiquitin-related modifier 1-like [Ctenocephalides felis]XP_026477789.1 small ubiquitin-related modifier 1-like [Ctenocephalides felis]
MDLINNDKFINVTVICPDQNEIPFQMRPNVQMGRLMNLFLRRECLENIDFLVFYHKGRRIRSTDTPITLSLSDGDKIKTHIPEPDHDDYDSDCVYLSE